MLLRLLLRWVVIGVAIAGCAYVLEGVHVDSPLALAIAAGVLALVNMLVRPILFWLTLPITIVTLGLFFLIVNGVAFGLTAWLVEGFRVDGPLPAIGGALLVSVLSWLVGLIVRPSRG